MFTSRSCQLICRFITSNTLMTWHPHQLNSVMFGQLHKGLMALAAEQDLMKQFYFKIQRTKNYETLELHKCELQ
jgi:hypothetical protein